MHKEIFACNPEGAAVMDGLLAKHPKTIKIVTITCGYFQIPNQAPQMQQGMQSQMGGYESLMPQIPQKSKSLSCWTVFYDAPDKKEKPKKK